MFIGCLPVFDFRCNATKIKGNYTKACYTLKLSFEKHWLYQDDYVKLSDANKNSNSLHTCLERVTYFDGVMVLKLSLHYWHLLQGIHRSPVVSAHKRPEMRSIGDFCDGCLNTLFSKQQCYSDDCYVTERLRNPNTNLLISMPRGRSAVESPYRFLDRSFCLLPSFLDKLSAWLLISFVAGYTLVRGTTLLSIYPTRILCFL